MHQPPKTKREHLRQLVAGKNLAHPPLTEAEKNKGFLGWHERGYLPHCDFPDLIQFVTFRLHDSMPESRRGEWEHLLKIEDITEKRVKLEEYLDRGVGECQLRNPLVAKIAEDALLHFHNDWYDLLAWCIMPNHVHVLVHIWDKPMWKLIQSWKRYAATRVSERRTPIRREQILQTAAPNRSSALQKIRPFWEREYWDTFMRDTDQEQRSIRYIEANPVKAKLCPMAADWPFSSARFRDQYQRLAMPMTGTPNSDSASSK